MALRYFQATAVRCVHRDRLDMPKLAAAAAELDLPGHSKARGGKGSMKSVGIGDKAHRAALFVGIGTALLVLIGALVWRKRKRGGIAEGSRAKLSAGRTGIAQPRYHDDWYLSSTPPHWPDKDRRENVYGVHPSVDLEEWNATGSLDR